MWNIITCSDDVSIERYIFTHLDTFYASRSPINQTKKGNIIQFTTGDFSLAIVSHQNSDDLPFFSTFIQFITRLWFFWLPFCVEKAIKFLLAKRLQTNYDNKYLNELNHSKETSSTFDYWIITLFFVCF